MERSIVVQWCTKTDNFRFQINVQYKPVTRHGIMSMVSSIYNPLGYSVPIMLPFKVHSWDLCKKKHVWYKEIENWHAKMWCEWLSNLEILTGLIAPKCIKPEGFRLTVSTAASFCWWLHHVNQPREQKTLFFGEGKIKSEHMSSSAYKQMFGFNAGISVQTGGYFNMNSSNGKTKISSDGRLGVLCVLCNKLFLLFWDASEHLSVWKSRRLPFSIGAMHNSKWKPC